MNRNDLNQKQTNLLQTDKISVFEKPLTSSPSAPMMPRTNTSDDREAQNKLIRASPK